MARPSDGGLADALDARLMALVELAQHSLEQTWSEIGTTADERGAAAAALKERLTETFLAALTRETELRDGLQAELADAIGEIEDVASELGEPFTLPAQIGTGSLRKRVGACAHELERWQARRAERALIIDALRDEVRTLSTQLGEPTEMPRERAPLSADAHARLDSRARALRAERARRVEQRASLVAQIASLRAALTGEQATSGSEGGEADSLSLRALAELDAELGLLESTRKEREAQIGTIAHRISEICSELGLQLDPEAARSASSDLREEAVASWASELERLEKLRRASLSRLVDEARQELEELSSQLGVPLPELPARVAPAQAGGGAAEAGATEALEATLAELGAQLERLRARQQEAAPILKLRARRSELRAQRVELEESMADKTRLTSRKDPGRLLREERARKVCSVETPRVTAKLLDALRAWEAKRAEPFLFGGRSLLDTILAEEEFEAAEAEAKRAQRSAPRHGGPPPAAASGASGLSRTPTSARLVGGGGGGDGGQLAGTAMQGAGRTPGVVAHEVGSAAHSRSASAPRGGYTPSSAQRPATASAAEHALSRAGASPASAAGANGGGIGNGEVFRPVPLSLHQILAAAMLDDDDAAADGAGGNGSKSGGAASPGDGSSARKTLTYRLRDEAAVAIAAAEAVRRATMAEGARRPQSARERGTMRKAPATTGHMTVRTVESVVALAARLKADARKNADAAASRGRPGKPMHGTPSKAVLKAFAENNRGLTSPSDLIDLMSPPQH